MIYLIRKGYWWQDKECIQDRQDQPCAFTTEESAKDYVMCIFNGWKKNYGEKARVVERPEGGLETMLDFGIEDDEDETHYYCFYTELKVDWA